MFYGVLFFLVSSLLTSLMHVRHARLGPRRPQSGSGSNSHTASPRLLPGRPCKRKLSISRDWLIHGICCCLTTLLPNVSWAHNTVDQVHALFLLISLLFPWPFPDAVTRGHAVRVKYQYAVPLNALVVSSRILHPIPGPRLPQISACPLHHVDCSCVTRCRGW